MKRLFSLLTLSQAASAGALELGKEAPLFTLQDQEGRSFSLADRKGKGWTVLYFYPKADTPGCTKQACAFRDSLKSLTELGAAVFGISSDQVADQKKFHDKHKLSFDLLADPKKVAIGSYQVGGMLGMARRDAFLIDDKLILQWHGENVDPVRSPGIVEAEIKRLKVAPGK